MESDVVVCFFLDNRVNVYFVYRCSGSDSLCAF